MLPARTIDLTADGLLLQVVTTGASVRRLAVVSAGREVDLLLGLLDPAGYADNGAYLGATVGRYANRIAGGHFPLGGRTVHLATNQHGNTLHGGPDGFDGRPWTVVEEGTDHVTLTLTSPDGDQGFPGTLEVTVTYRVAPGEVTIEHLARTDAPTVVSLTTHAYVQLDGAGSGTVDDHTVQVDAGVVLPVREDTVPTGELRAVDGTPFDLRAPRRVADVLAADDEQLRRAAGLDHCYLLPGTGMRRAARAVGSSGRWLEVHTDRPGLQVYTGQHLADADATGLHGRRHGARDGLALETQELPDAPNHPDFPSAVLRPGEEYRGRTVWRLGG